MENYLLGSIDKITEDEIIAIVGSSTGIMDWDKLYGILTEASYNMSEYDKMEFLRGEKLDSMIRDFDSLYEVAVEKLEGYDFNLRYGGGGSVPFGDHIGAIGDRYLDCTEEIAIYTAIYQANVEEAANSVTAYIDSLLGEVANMQNRTSGFLEWRYVGSGK